MDQQSRWLLAWMNQEEAIPALLGRTPAPNEDITQPLTVWHDLRAALLRRAPYRQPTPALAKPPAQLKKQAEEFRQRPDVIADLYGQDWTIAVVDLRHLLSLRRVVDEGALRRAQQVIPDDPGSLFSFCLPRPGRDARVAGTLDKVNKAITLTSQNWNFHIGSPLMLDLDVSPGPGQPLRKEKHIGFIVGFGPSFVQVIECNGRWLLRDGYHRCYGLLQRSMYRVPCVFSKARNFADIGLLAPGPFPEEILFGDRPPLLTDLLDDAVARTARRAAEQKVIRIAASEFVVET
jgi:hypothetical protein